MAMRTFGVVLFLAAAVSFAAAQSTETKKASDCCGTKAKATAGASGCHDAAGGAAAKASGCGEKSGGCGEKAEGASCEKSELVRKSIPTMKYRVGEETLCCPSEAEKLAKSKEATIQFVVADKTYDDEAEAKKAYAKVLDGYMTEMVAVKYAVGEECVACPVTAREMAQKEKKPMTYRVAAYDFKTEEQAKKAVLAAKEAAGKVALKTVVGEKEFGCCDSAAAAAKAENKKVEYKVGDKATNCPVEADVNLALARIDAALNALAEVAKG